MELLLAQRRRDDMTTRDCAARMLLKPRVRDSPWVFWSSGRPSDNPPKPDSLELSQRTSWGCCRVRHSERLVPAAEGLFMITIAEHRDGPERDDGEEGHAALRYPFLHGVDEDGGQDEDDLEEDYLY